MNTESTNDNKGGGSDHDKKVSVKVNNKLVNFEDHKTTGSQIKSTAIAQNVNIQQDFNLFEDLNNNQQKPIADNDPVTLHPNQEFTAVAPDDTSNR